MKDLRKVPTEPYIPRQYPKEGLIPAHMNYLSTLSVLSAARMGWSIKQPV